MYYSKDTVMRIIERLGDFWRRLMGKLDDVEVQQELDQAYQRFCGLNRQTAEQLDVPSLLALLSEDQRMALSELTYFRARRKTEEMDEDALRGLYLRALVLLTSIESVEIAETRTGQAEILLDEAGDALSEEEAIDALWFLERGGAYDKAEDLLFAQLDRWPREREPQPLLEEGEALYDRLEALPEQVLLAGGFSPEEVREGRVSLRRRHAAEGDKAP